jgi:DNA-binding transcriptional MerR regulator
MKSLRPELAPVAFEQRKYFRIGEVSIVVGVEPHVLRYWETQFPQLVKPQKARSGHRLYKRRDVDALRVIHGLLHVQRFTIAGARQAMKGETLSALVDKLPPFALPEKEATADVKEVTLTLHNGGAVEVDLIAADGDELAQAMEEDLALIRGGAHDALDVSAESDAIDNVVRPAAMLPVRDAVAVLRRAEERLSRWLTSNDATEAEDSDVDQQVGARVRAT